VVALKAVAQLVGVNEPDEGWVGEQPTGVAGPFIECFQRHEHGLSVRAVGAQRG